jgi:tetratricopeptide (TPR) repeat protein
MPALLKRLTASLLCVLTVAAVAAREPARTPPMPPMPQAPPLHQDADAPHRSLMARDADWAPERLLEGMSQYLPAALRATRQPDPTMRRGGLFILGMLGLPEGVPVARQALGDPDRLVRMQAGVALAMLYDPTGLDAAAECLRTGPDWTRTYALYGLFRLNSAASLQALRDSRPTLPASLQPTLDQALKTPPRIRCNNARWNKPNGNLSLYELWSAVSGQFVIESDIWWHHGDYDQCIRTQQTALFFDPGYIELWTNIAWLQWSMGRHAEAISTYRRCIAANPKSWEAHQALGDYYWHHRQQQLGVQHLQQAADLGSPPLPRRQLGHAYRDLGETEKAKQVWRDILKLDPNDPIARRELERAK